MGSTSKAHLISSLLVLLLAQSSNVNAKGRASFTCGEWNKGIATFYDAGDGTGQEGSCGYRGTAQDLKHQLAALGPDLYNGGQGCGACYEVRCIGDQTKCKQGVPPLTVTAANCGPSDLNHFDLSTPAFLKLLSMSLALFPLSIAGLSNQKKSPNPSKYKLSRKKMVFVHDLRIYCRIPCQRQGGIRFTMDANGNPYANLVTVWNVAGAGDVTNVQVKVHDEPNWLPMRRNWGQKWQSDAKLVGKALSFRVFTSDRRSSTSRNVVPKDWKFGQTFEGKNFR